MEVDILDLSARGISSLHTFWSSEQFLLRWMESMVQTLWLTGHGIVVWYAFQFLPNILSSKAVIFFWSTKSFFKDFEEIAEPPNIKWKMEQLWMKEPWGEWPWWGRWKARLKTSLFPAENTGSAFLWMIKNLWSEELTTSCPCGCWGSKKEWN